MALSFAIPVTILANDSHDVDKSDESKNKDKNDTNEKKPGAVPGNQAGVVDVIQRALVFSSLAMSVYSQYKQLQALGFGTRISQLSSNINLKDLNRDIPPVIKALVAFYKNPERFTTHKPEIKRWFFQRWYHALQRWYEGVSGYQKPCSGIVLHGEPGCGKTEYIRAIAGEGLPVFALSGSEIRQPYYGQSEDMIRNIYSTANYARYGGILRWIFNKPLHPCVIVFLDEIDSIGGERGQALDSDTHGSVLNQLLTILDGTQKYDNIVTVVATNRKDMLDSALVRSGRLDVKLEVKNPTQKEKKAIISKKFDGLSLKRSKSLDILFDGKVLDELSTADCAHLPKLCHTILKGDALEKEENSKFTIRGQTFWTTPYTKNIEVELKPVGKRIKVDLQPGRMVVGTKTFEQALAWMGKNKNNEESGTYPSMYL